MKFKIIYYLDSAWADDVIEADDFVFQGTGDEWIMFRDQERTRMKLFVRTSEVHRIEIVDG